MFTHTRAFASTPTCTYASCKRSLHNIHSLYILYEQRLPVVLVSSSQVLADAAQAFQGVPSARETHACLQAQLAPEMESSEE